MKTLPVLQPITTPVGRLHADTLRTCALNTKRVMQGFLTGAEAYELQELHGRIDARARADLAHDQATEAHAFPRNPNIHDD